MDEVGGDDFVQGIVHDSLEVGFGGFFHRLANFLIGGVLGGTDSKVNHADGGCWHAKGHAGEFSLNLGTDETYRLGRSRSGGDDVDGGRASTFPIFAGGAVDGFLRGRVTVHGGHQSFFDAETFLKENVNHRRQTVRGA